MIAVPWFEQAEVAIAHMLRKDDVWADRKKKYRKHLIEDTLADKRNFEVALALGRSWPVDGCGSR
jgi:hypothetical protein